MKYKIYTLCCSKTKEIRYVGVTIRSLKQRLYQHVWNSNKILTPCAKWIKSLQQEVEIELLEEVEENTWEAQERYWIGQMKSWNFRLLNVENGGVGVNRGRRSKSEDSKKKPVLKFTMTGKFVCRYESIKEAVKACNLKSSSSLTNHLLSGHGRHVAGFRWAYEGTVPRAYRQIKVIVDDLEYFYPDLITAAKTHLFCRNKAREFLEGKRGPLRGLQIEYDIV